MRSKHESTEAEPDDGALLRRLCAGDGRAFDVLFARHRRGLLAYGLSLTGDRGLAEDVVQETFLALVRNLEGVDPRRGVSGWLYRVARNRALDLRRRRHRECAPGAESLTELQEARAVAGPASDGVLAREREVALQGALARLPAAEREVLVLRYFSDLTFREVAQALGQPLGTVLWRAHTALSRLRRRETEGGTP